MQKRVRVDDNWVLARGQKVHGPRWFRVEEYLGRGAFAAAYRVTDADGEEYFLKEYLPPAHPSQRAERQAMYRQERRILMRVSGHELCPTLHAAFSDCGFDYLVQSFIHGRDMETVLASHEPRGEARILRWAVCLTRAVAHLHARRIVHQDLKPANIRLDLNDDPVLLDFGAARDFSLDEAAAAEETVGEYGTDGYMPPERARGGERGLEAGCQVDVFALGAILVEAMIGQRLTQEEINAQKERLFGALIHSATLPAAFVQAVFKALAYDPRQRYVSAEAMLEELLPIAPPVGRVDQRYLEFGRVEPGVPLKRTLCAYNAGGGVLQGQVEVEGDWLHIAVVDGKGAGARSFTGNRQSVVVMALPERVPRREAPTEGEVRFVFPSGLVRVRCAISRTALPADVHVSPGYLQIRPAPLGRTVGSLLFENRGEMPAAVSLRAHPSHSLVLEPGEFELEAGAQATVQVEWRPAARQAEHLWDWLHRGRRAGDADPAAARPVEYLLEWQVDGGPGGFVPVEMVSLWSLPRSVTDRFRRPGIDEGVRE
jgi:tRNA A-37 threonylcarbamoyl transferase component Bud32